VNTIMTYCSISARGQVAVTPIVSVVALAAIQSSVREYHNDS
jgi:hypothetical protein